MFILSDGTVVTSASDLTMASKCEFAFLRKLDQLRGRIEPLTLEEDKLMNRTAALGDEHELRVLRQYRDVFGAGVREFARPDPLTRDSMSEAAALSSRAFSDGADVVFQATMFEDDPTTGTAFVGFADFITRQPDGSYRVEDTKLARSEKVTAVLQLAAYADVLRRNGTRVDDTVTLLLGDGTPSHHLVDDLLPVYRVRRRRLLELLRTRNSEGADGSPVEWGDDRFSICGACDHCTAEIEAQRDVLLVANLRRSQRERLAGSGIHTIDQLAESTGMVEGIGARTLENLRAQARLQLKAAKGEAPPYEVTSTAPILTLPAPDPGDIFFDFEGDPLYTEGSGHVWGIDYLFGLIEADGTFRAFWAHDFAEEGRALRDFLDYVTARRAQYPNMRIYHYAPYERTHLAQLAIRHGYGEEIVDDLFRRHVLVDLYATVRGAVRAGSPSYSIKKLEPLYMGANLRNDEGVTNAGDSIVEYAEAVELRERGDLRGYHQKLDKIAEYNEYDCRSTLALRDWLRSLTPDAAKLADVGEVAERAEPTLSGLALEEATLSETLLQLAGDPLTVQEDGSRFVAALASAAVRYYAREDKKGWWEHFARLLEPIDEWADDRDVLAIDGVEVLQDWYRETPRQNLRRTLRLTGTAGPGSKFITSDQPNARLVYETDSDAPRTERDDPRARPAHQATVTAVEDAAPDDVVIVREVLRRGEEPYSSLPIALVPGGPLGVIAQRTAILEWASRLLASYPEVPRDPAGDIMLRRHPRTKSGRLDPAAVLDSTALAAAIRDVDGSYLAVQGPPGTGKTHTGAHAIAELVREGWRVGITAQSHAVIDNFLSGVVRAGAGPAQLVHVSGNQATPYDSIDSSRISAWADDQPGGYVIGATAWAFANEKQIARRQLNLLVIDEAGQFSLANTIAVSLSAQRVLLLGDPQQLPQVSQGTHPQPVDESALGWIADGASVLPSEFGYFLPLTRRMDAALTGHVSRLSYADALHAHECTRQRHLEHWAPGLHALPVEHAGNSVASAEEASVVVERKLVGAQWTDPSSGRTNDPLRPADIIIVTPYNAQRQLLRDALAAEGFADMAVGTVDKFQGREAVVSIVSLAASDASEVPRGMEFLINRNRLNVAISRAQWASWLVHSPALTAHLPATVAGVKELSAFVRLTQPDGTL